MKQGYRKGMVSSNICISNNIYEIKLITCSPGLGFEGKPGQFYMVKVDQTLDPFLSRPISIADISDGILTLLYELKGKGTRILSKLRRGEVVDLLGPLGSGFDMALEGRIAFVSGGIGMAPLVYFMKQSKADIDFYCGFRDRIYYIDQIKRYIDNIYITTEDGSAGHKGFITELLTPEKYNTIITCGPVPMMKKVVDMCNNKNIAVYVSMEGRMACGIGTCLGCSTETTSGMQRVCKEGPVFAGEEVVFDDQY